MKLTVLAESLQAARLRRPVMHWRVLHVPIWMHALSPALRRDPEYLCGRERSRRGLAGWSDRLMWTEVMKGNNQ